MRRSAFLLVLLLAIPASAATVNAEGRPGEKEATPAVEDWSSVHIRLERGSCAEGCPVYSVEIDGDGAVTYTGEEHVWAKGRRTAQISRDKVRELVKKFQKAEFFWTFTFYEGPAEAPTDRLSLSFDSREHAVADQGGAAPRPVADLFEAIDKAAGDAKWVNGSEPETRHGKPHEKSVPPAGGPSAEKLGGKS